MLEANHIEQTVLLEMSAKSGSAGFAAACILPLRKFAHAAERWFLVRVETWFVLISKRGQDCVLVRSFGISIRSYYTRFTIFTLELNSRFPRNRILSCGYHCAERRNRKCGAFANNGGFVRYLRITAKQWHYNIPSKEGAWETKARCWVGKVTIWEQVLGVYPFQRHCKNVAYSGPHKRTVNIVPMDKIPYEIRLLQFILYNHATTVRLFLVILITLFPHTWNNYCILWS